MTLLLSGVLVGLTIIPWFSDRDSWTGTLAGVCYIGLTFLSGACCAAVQDASGGQAVALMGVQVVILGISYKVYRIVGSDDD